MPWLSTNNVSETRRNFLNAYDEGVPLPTLMKAYGIKKSSAYALLRRARLESVEAAIEVKSRAPHRRPTTTSSEVEERIVALKKRWPAWGPKKLRTLYEQQHGEAPSASTLANILRQNGLVRPYVQRRSHPPQQMREATASNDVWAVDHKGPMKQLGRIEPLTTIDVYSRYWLGCGALVPKSYVETRRHYEELFMRFGLPRTIRVDAGTLWVAPNSLLRLTRLSAWWVALGIEIEIAPSCQLNGVVERLHGTMERDMQPEGVLDVRRHLEEQRKTYNEVRPHEGIGMKTPSSLYTPSPLNKLGERPFDQLTYGFDVERHIGREGYFVWRGSRHYLSEGLAGRVVGIRQLNNETISVRYYGYELLMDERSKELRKPPLAPTADPA